MIERDPAWLAQGTSTASLFKPNNDAKQALVLDHNYDGPLRRIAHRGTEVFVVAGNELRWSDLGMLKDIEEDLDRGYSRPSREDGSEKAYRVGSSIL